MVHNVLDIKLDTLIRRQSMLDVNVKEIASMHVIIKLYYNRAGEPLRNSASYLINVFWPR